MNVPSFREPLNCSPLPVFSVSLGIRTLDDIEALGEAGLQSNYICISSAEVVDG